MRKITMTAAVMGLGVLASGLAANAQYFNFSTSWSPSITDNGNTLAFAPGGSAVANFAFPTGTDIVLANTNITGSGNYVAPIAAGGYSVQVTLNETTAGNVIKQSVVDTFSGTLSGAFSANLGSGITNAYNNPTSITTTFADGYKYTVSLDGFVAPQFGNGANAAGSIGALVSAQAPVNTNSTPEPGALALLSGISVPGVILGARRRKKANA